MPRPWENDPIDGSAAGPWDADPIDAAAAPWENDPIDAPGGKGPSTRRRSARPAADVDIANFDANTTMGERAGSDLKRGGLNFVQSLVGSMLRDPDPLMRQTTPADDALGLTAPHGLPEETEQQFRGQAATDLVQRGRQIAAIPRRPVMAQLSQAASFPEAIETIGRDPLGAMAGTALESAPAMVPGLVAGAVNPVAGAAVMGGTSAFQETNSGVLDFLQRQGVDFNDPAAVVAAFENPDMLRQAEAFGLTRGAIIGTLDTLTGGLASKTLIPKALVGSAVAREATNIPAQMVAQAAGGGGGEALAQVATEGKITSPGDVVAEVVGETATAPAEVAAFSAQRAADAVRQRRQERIFAAIQQALEEEDATAVPPAPAPVQPQAQPDDGAPAPVSPPAQPVVPGVVPPAAAASAASATPIPTALAEVREALGGTPTSNNRTTVPLESQEEAEVWNWMQDASGPYLANAEENGSVAIPDAVSRAEPANGKWAASFDNDPAVLADIRYRLEEQLADIGADGNMDPKDRKKARADVRTALRILDRIESATPAEATDGNEVAPTAPAPGQPGRVEAIAPPGAAGIEQSGGVQQGGVEAAKARKGRFGKGPKDQHADQPVGRSFYTRVFEDAGIDPVEAELMPADKQFGVISGQLQSKYGFRKIEKENGHNWRDTVDAAMDAHQNLTGMAASLGLPASAMSLNGQIDLGFTKGGDGALAWHAGMGKKGSVIAVSRRNRAYAHEWMHGLDHHLLERSGAKNAGLITGRLLTGKIRRGLDVSNQEPDLTDAVGNVLHAMYRDDAKKAALIRTLELRIEKETDPAKLKVLKKQLQAARKNMPPESSYYSNATTLDKGKYETPEKGHGNDKKGYWQRPTEMWARAGEAYIGHQIDRIGGGDGFVSLKDRQYLDESIDFIKKAYPQQEDRQRIFEAFDQLFDVIRNLQIFGTEKPPRPNTDNASFDALDPRLWSATKKPFTPQPYYRRAVERLRKEINDVLPQIKRETKALAQRGKNTQDKWDEPTLTRIERLMTGVLYTGRGDMIFLAERYPQSQAIQEAFRKLVTRPGTGEMSGATYEDYVELFNRRWLNRMNNIAENFQLEDLTEAEHVALRELLSGVRTRGPTRLMQAAAKIGQLQDQVWSEMDNEGVVVGYVKENYLNRIYDHPAIEARPNDFVEQATKVYELVFSDIQDLAEREAKARMAAQDWLFRIRRGPSEDFTKTGIDSAITARRKLPPEADKLLADFMVQDPIERIETYILQSARRTAWAKLFGPEGEGFTELLDQMGREGVRGEDIQTFQNFVAAIRGQHKSLLPTTAHAGVAWVQTIGMLRLLPRAVFSSLPESALVAMQTRDVRDAFKGIANTFAVAFKTDRGRAIRDFNEAFGLIAAGTSDQMLANRYGGAFLGTKATTWIMHKFMSLNFMHPLTQAQRAGNTPVGIGYFNHLAKLALSSEETGPNKAAIAELSEYGIPPARAEEFAKWLLKQPTLDIAALEKAPPTMRELYVVALNRFNYQTIQDPRVSDKPILASTDVGRLLFAIMGFAYSFQRNVLIKSAKLMTAGATGKYGAVKLTPQERLTHFGFGFIPAIATAYALHLTVSVVRDMLFNGEAFEDQGDDFWERATSKDSLMRATSRAGAYGAWDPLFNAATGLRYSRDLASTAVGPVIGSDLHSIQRIAKPFIMDNPRTNADEYNAIKGFYELAVVPALSTGLSLAPGAGSPLLKPVYSGMLMQMTSPDASDAVAEAIVGPKGTKTDPDE